MSKRSGDTPDRNDEKKKRKHLCLSIADKVSLLRKFDNGVSTKDLIAEYGVGATTIYDLRKQKEKILRFHAASQEESVVQAKPPKKNMQRTKRDEFESILMEWINQRQREHTPLSNALIMQQARLYHGKLNIQTNCEYSHGWLQKFKKRNGIKLFSVSSSSSDYGATEQFISHFTNIISDENLSPEQIYNADEMSLFWRYCPEKVLKSSNKEAYAMAYDPKDRVTILGCANAAGTHKCKLTVIGKSRHPRCFRGMNTSPVHYYAHNRAFITKDIFSDWFNKQFIPSARAHCTKVGLGDNCKILLFLDNCSAHPLAELLVKDNVYAVFFPVKVTFLLQPLEQGILRAVKRKYKFSFLYSMLSAVNRGLNVKGFLKEFTMKDAIYAVASAWNKIDKNMLVKAWNSLWPETSTTVNENGEQSDIAKLREEQEEKMITDLLMCAKIITVDDVYKLEKGDIEEVLGIDDDVPVTHASSESDMAAMSLNYNDSGNNSEDEDDVDDTELVPMDRMVRLCDELVAGLEQRAFITEQEIMSVFSVKERLIQHKPLLMKQMALEETFTKVVQPKVSSSVSLPSPSSSSTSDVHSQNNIIIHVLGVDPETAESSTQMISDVQVLTA